MTLDPEEISSLTTAQLVERFAANARRMGNPQRPRDPRNLKPRTPEFEAVSGDLRAVASAPVVSASSTVLSSASTPAACKRCCKTSDCW